MSDLLKEPMKNIQKNTRDVVVCVNLSTIRQYI